MVLVEEIRVVNALINNAFSSTEFEDYLSSGSGADNLRSALQWRSLCNRIVKSDSALSRIIDSDIAFPILLNSSTAMTSVATWEQARTLILSASPPSSLCDFVDGEDRSLEISESNLSMNFEDWSIQLWVHGLGLNPHGWLISKAIGDPEDEESTFAIHWDGLGILILLWGVGLDGTEQATISYTWDDMVVGITTLPFMLTFVRDPNIGITEQSLYLNDRQFFPSSANWSGDTFARQDGNRPLKIGNIDGSSDPAGDSFSGKIEEVRLYNISLTPEDVAASYRNRLQEFDLSGLHAYWPLVDDFEDKTNNANHLSVPSGASGPQSAYSPLSGYVNALRGLFHRFFNTIHTGADEPTLAYVTNDGFIHLKSWGDGGDDGDENTATLIFTVDLTGYNTLQVDGHAIDDAGGDNQEIFVGGDNLMSSAPNDVADLDVSSYSGSTELKFSGYSTFNASSGYDGLEIRRIQLL